MSRAARTSRAMNRSQRVFSLGIILFLLVGAGGFLVFKYHGRAHRQLSTTPSCLSRKGTLCTGIALATLKRADLSHFTQETGVFPSIIEYYQSFGTDFSTDNASLVAEIHARPLVQINPHGVSMADIASGKYDVYLNKYAKQVKAFGHKIMLSFGHEMNGNWSTWSLPWTKPGDFVAGWKHIHDIFERNHVHNVIWAWDFSTSWTGKGAPARNPAPWWPGTAYVDWIGMDGYLIGHNTFAGRFDASLKFAKKIAGKKPIFIAETGVAPGSSEASTIKNLFYEAQHHKMVALVWFDVNKRKQWRLEGNPVASAAFRAAAESGSK